MQIFLSLQLQKDDSLIWDLQLLATTATVV